MPKHKTVTHIVSLILEVEDRFLLLHKPARRGGKYSLIGGRVDVAEAVIAALVREALEEAAVEVLPEHLRLVHVIHRRREHQDFFHFFFRAEQWAGEIQNREPLKCDELLWYSRAELPFDTMMPAICCGIQGYLAGEYYSELGWQSQENDPQTIEGEPQTIENDP